MLLIKNAKVFTMAEKDFPDGADILIDNGKILAVGDNISQNGAEIINANGLYALPGVIDSHSHIGMWEDGMGFEGSDGNEMTNPVTPQLRAIDAINPDDRCFEEALSGGVTMVATGPGSANVIGGQFAALHTYGRGVEGKLIKAPLSLKAAFGENPKRVYSGQKATPSTRMATASILRQAFVDAQEYDKKMALPEADKRPARDLGKEIISRVLRGELPLKAHAHRADDIRTALRIAQEFNIKISLEHCTEGYLIPEELLKAKCPVILGPLFSDRSKIELKNMTFAAPAILNRAGVEFAMMTDHPVIPVQYLIVCAAIAVREGLPEREALKSITINAARAIGLSGEYGSLEAGKQADLALYDAHPLDARANVRMTFISGEKVYEK